MNNTGGSGGDCRDYKLVFVTGEKFDTELEAIAMAKEIAKENRFFLVNGLGKRNTKEVHRRVYLCMVRDIIANGDGVNPGHLDYFWSSLDYLAPRVIRSERENDEELTRDSLDKLVDEACSRGEPAIRALIQVVQAHVHPESQNIKEPKESNAPKGTPPQQSTKRRMTWYEHETAKYSRSNPTTVAAYLKYIIHGVRPYVSKKCFNPEGDGHCGF
ncbi:hypothetical protein LINGRAHAP2_LOCUS23277 [Linum grandiflorum]